MMHTAILAAGAADPERGSGGLWGIFVAALACYLVWRVDVYLKERKGEGGPPSPDGPPVPVRRETPQVDPVSSHVSPEETPGASHWWGRVERVGNSWRRVYDKAAHVAKTGDSPPRPEGGRELPEAYDPPADFEIDLPFDDVDDDDGGEDAPPAPETIDQYVQRCRRNGVKTAAIVAGLQQYYGRSRAQAYRDAGPAGGASRAA